MIRICAWCEQEVSEKVRMDGSTPLDRSISHGICRQHARRLRQGFLRDISAQNAKPFYPSAASSLYSS